MAWMFILASVSDWKDFGITTFHARDETFGDEQLLSPKLTTFFLWLNVFSHTLCLWDRLGEQGVGGWELPWFVVIIGCKPALFHAVWHSWRRSRQCSAPLSPAWPREAEALWRGPRLSPSSCCAISGRCKPDVCRRRLVWWDLGVPAVWHVKEEMLFGTF